MYPYKDYTRMGGWLLVFVIWSVLQILVNVVAGIDLLMVVPLSALLAIVGHGCLRAAMLTLLFRRSRACTKLLAAEAGVTVVEVVVTLANAVQVGTDEASLMGMLFGSIVGSALFYVGWLLYFQRSMRAQAYFSGINPMPPYGAGPGWPPYGYGQQPPMGGYGQQPPAGGYGAPYPPGGYSASPPAPDGTVRYCPHCGRPVQDASALFCAGCGEPLHPGEERRS